MSEAEVRALRKKADEGAQAFAEIEKMKLTGHVRQAGVDSRCNGSGDRDLGSDGSDAFRVTDGTFDGATTAIAAVKSGAIGAPLRGCGT